MKNYEKYADELKEYKGLDFCKDFVMPNILKSDNCNGLACGACYMLQMIWLLEDYEEPEEPKEHEVDWSKVEVDTPVLVRDNENNEWRRFYFAKYENGLVYTWVAGATSWTAKGNMYKWRFAKLAESEDKCEKTNKEEPETDWSKVEVDTPILVRDSEDENWHKRHFAMYKNGVIYTWDNGQTSWTKTYITTAWKYAKLAESEEKCEKPSKEETKEPETDWSKVKVDTPILVRQGEKGKWLRRHFAKYGNGLVYAWKDSRTSWTANNMTTAWKYAKLAESEDE